MNTSDCSYERITVSNVNRASTRKLSGTVNTARHDGEASMQEAGKSETKSEPIGNFSPRGPWRAVEQLVSPCCEREDIAPGGVTTLGRWLRFSTQLKDP